MARSFRPPAADPSRGGCAGLRARPAAARPCREVIYRGLARAVMRRAARAAHISQLAMLMIAAAANP